MDHNNDATAGDGTTGDEDNQPDDREVETETVTQFHHLCKGKVDEEGTCTIKDEIIEVREDSVYRDAKIVSLVFNNTKIICAKHAKTGEALDQFCDVTFELKNSKENTT